MEDSKAEYQLKVGGKRFALDSTDVEALGSSFLKTLIDPKSKFAQPDDGIFMVAADAACFSAFLFHSRFGVLPQLPVPDTFFLAQADFWGGDLLEKVSAELKKTSYERSSRRSESLKLAKLTSELEDAKEHHNNRTKDQYGNLCCTECCRAWGSLIRSPFVCEGCEAKVFFTKKNLGWCHKCSLCRKCQRKKIFGCPNDSDKACETSKTTKQLEREIKLLTRDLGML